MDIEKTAAIQQIVNKPTPIASTDFRLVISATLPAGTEQAATASVYPVTSQPTIPAPAWNSCDRSGMDKLSALPVNVVTNAVSTTTRIVSFGFWV